MYIISSISLRNIKSHRDTQVGFSKGVNLIIGDVGAGKSTILEAIEAGLLGFRVKGLLRVGSREGEIFLALEPRFEIRRKISQRGAGEVFVVLEDGRKAMLTTTQARELVVKKLRLMEQADPKAEPLVTRAAIYVRQEEMKRILDEPERAAEVVKRATGILKFSIARENSLVVGKALNERARGMKDRVEDLLKELEKEKEYERLRKEAERKLKEVDKDLLKVKARLEKEKELRERLEEEIKGLKELKGRSERLEKELVEKESEVKGKEKELQRMDRELRKLKKERHLIVEEAELEEMEGRLKELEAKHDELVGKEEEERRLVKEVSRLKKKVEGAPFERLNELEGLEEEKKKAEEDLTKVERELSVLKNEGGNYRKLVKSGRCWVCGRSVDPKNYAYHLEEIKRKISVLERSRKELKARVNETEKRLKILERIKSLLPYKEELRRVERELKDIRNLISKLRPIDRKYRELREMVELAKKGLRIRDKEGERGRLAEELGRLAERIKDIRRELKMLKEKTHKAKELELRVVEVKRRIDELGELEKRLVSMKSALKRDLEHYGEKLKELKEKEKEYERLRKEAERLQALARFFAETMPQYLEDIESAETLVVRAELTSKFREYFKLLTQNDDWDVEIADDFSPKFKVRLSGRWEEISMPSGGQRSCIALAYRLALSWVARAHQGLNVDFLMLDEPTDGFSSEQLARFKSLLERLEAGQVIMVSHHEELQSAADQIIKVENMDGVSSVSPA